MSQQKTVSLVLGSGAARGLAHIGVIEWLDEHGYRIQSIDGSSMGALVGGIYAAGKIEAYTQWVTALEKGDVIRFLDLSFSSEGLFKGERLFDLLRGMVGDHNIQDLPISYTAVATDLERHREVWLTEGSLFEAIRASIAIPTVFTPHPYRGMKLLDGGLLDPVPIAPTFRDLTDMTVAVNLNSPRKRIKPHRTGRDVGAQETEEAQGYRRHIKQFFEGLQMNLNQNHEDELGLLDLLTSSFEAMQGAISSVKLATYAPDVIIDIPRDLCKGYEFFRATEIIEVGYQLAADSLTAGQMEST